MCEESKGLSSMLRWGGRGGGLLLYFDDVKIIATILMLLVLNVLDESVDFLGIDVGARVGDDDVMAVIVGWRQRGRGSARAAGGVRDGQLCNDCVMI